ncbi:MAG: 4Fe-4S dicluster domain-containing protein [Bacteroidales bacterium]|jgi:ferredoxin|nr:4Fe-4S dicluster domain-containing protein [Bacteroidales bacterium]
MLRKIRIALAIIVGVFLTLYILDFAEWVPHEFYMFSMWQFFPALLAHFVLIVGILLALTFIFGRLYCSILCPMGVFQDVIIWISNRKIFRRIKRKQGIKPQGYRKPKTWLRITVLALSIISVIVNFTILLALIEPYSAYSRIITHLVRPLYMWGNNALESITSTFGVHTFFRVEIFISSVFALVISALTFATILFLAWYYGRSFCSAVCPTGTILGFVNRGSIFKMRIDNDKCTHCGSCAYKCKAHCIDTKNVKIDTSRCVNCFDCIDACSSHAIKYKPSLRIHKTATPTDESRRKFIATAAVLPLLGGEKLLAKTTTALTASGERTIPIAPPGAISHEHLLNHCTSCHLCIDRCPSRVLKPATLEYGLGGIMQPLMDFEKGFCNYDCTICTTVCPNDALKPLTKEQKHLTQMGKVVFRRERCVVYKYETSCGACSEHCPTQAVKMVDYKDGLTIPQIDTSICVGCGGCEHICPVRPHRAIYVEGNTIHQQAVPITHEKQSNTEVEDFGF